MPRRKKEVEVHEIEPEPEVEHEVVDEPAPEAVEAVEVVEECEPLIKKPEKKNYKKTGTSRNKVRTEKQKEAWALCLQKKKEKQDEIRAQKAEDQRLLQEYKDHLKKLNEKKIVKKAIAIKKKAIMLDEELMDSDEEIPLEEVHEKIKQSRQKKKNVEPRVVKKEYPSPDAPPDRFILQFI